MILLYSKMGWLDWGNKRKSSLDSQYQMGLGIQSRTGHIIGRF